MKTNELAPLSETDVELVEAGSMSSADLIWWGSDGEMALKFLHDTHIKNIVLKLLGFSSEEYLGSEELKLLWLKAIHLEWKRRQGDRRATLNKNS